MLMTRTLLQISLPVLAVLLGTFANTRAQADDGLRVVVIRVSGALLEHVVSNPLRAEFPINTTYRGASVRGRVILTAASLMDFAGADLDAPLIIQLEGNLRSSTTAYKGPAIVGSSADSHFVGQFQLDFDGHQFSHTPISVDVNTSSRIECVGSTRGGIVGRLVQRVAWRRGLASLGQANRDASIEAKRQIESQGNDFLTKAVAELNETARFGRTLQSAFKGELAVVVSKTDIYLQIIATAVGERGTTPPSVNMLKDAPIEIWLLVPPNDPLVAEIETLWKTVESTLAAILPGGDELAAKAHEFVEAQVVGDWVVLHIGGGLAGTATVGE